MSNADIDIIVRSQAEWDALPSAFDRCTEAVIYYSETAQTIADAVVEARQKDADLGGAKGYVNFHAVFAEAVRRQHIETFTTAEWAAIGQIIVHQPCWETIAQRYADVAPHVLDVLAEAGFTEWRERWKALILEERP